MTKNFIRPLVDKFLIVPVYTNNSTAWNYAMLSKKGSLSLDQLEYYSGFHLSFCIVDTTTIIKKGDVALDLLNNRESGVHKVDNDYIASKFNNCSIIQSDTPFTRFVGCKQVVKIIASTDKTLNLNNVPEGLIEAWLEDPTIKIEDVFLLDGELQVVLNENYIPHQ